MKSFPKISIMAKEWIKHASLAILVLYVSLIMAFAVIPGVAGSEIVSQNDKLLHFLEFFLFSIILTITLYLYKVKYLYSYAIAISAIIIFASELIQIPVSARTFSWLDILAGITGAIIGIIIVSTAAQKWGFLKR